jgi:hypothetical protein
VALVGEAESHCNVADSGGVVPENSFRSLDAQSQQIAHGAFAGEQSEPSREIKAADARNASEILG